MLFKLFSYLKFIVTAKSKYGIYSPFVFDLITKGLNNNIHSKTYQKHLTFRKKLLANKNQIEVTDFGAGSKVFKDNYRAINRIAENAGINKKRARLLINLVYYFQPKNILEIGTSVGLGTAALHLGAPNSQITTLEGCPNTLNVAHKQFKAFDFENINVKVGEFTTSLKTINQSLDLVFFDGNHQKQPTIEYFECCLKYIHNNTVFIFDDIHWSKEMEDAWEFIKKHPKVSVSIDTYQWGIVFFRTAKQKEHFTIRI